MLEDVSGQATVDATRPLASILIGAAVMRASIPHPRAACCAPLPLAARVLHILLADCHQAASGRAGNRAARGASCANV